MAATSITSDAADSRNVIARAFGGEYGSAEDSALPQKSGRQLTR